MLEGLLQRPSTLFLLFAVGPATLAAMSSTRLSSDAELAIVAGAVAVAGLPHGAADGWLAVQDGFSRGRLRAIAFLGCYVALALLVIFAWQSYPIICLAGFLAVSAWHFGDDSRVGLHPIARLATGTIILSAPATFATAEVAEAYRALSGEGTEALVAGQQWLFWAACAILPVVLATCRPKIGNAHHLLDMIVLTLLATLLSPLSYFCIYFCGVHSPRHLTHILKMVPERHSRLFWVALVSMTLLSIAAGVLAFVWLSSSGQRPDVAGLKAVFIGLAALTLPHIILTDGLSSALRSERHNIK